MFKRGLGGDRRQTESVYKGLLHHLQGLKAIAIHLFGVDFKIKPNQLSKGKMNEIRKRLLDRTIVRQRACNAIFAIDEMRRNGTSFDELIQFHRKIQNVSDSTWAYRDDRECRPPVHAADRNVFVFKEGVREKDKSHFGIIFHFPFSTLMSV